MFNRPFPSIGPEPTCAEKLQRDDETTRRRDMGHEMRLDASTAPCHEETRSVSYYLSFSNLSWSSQSLEADASGGSRTSD